MQHQSASRNDVSNDNRIDLNNRSLVSDLVMGLRFYSRLPVPGFPHEVPDLNRMAPAIGFASVIFGIIPAALLVIFSLLGMPPLLSVSLAVAAYVIITGAMAEDALADSADGLFGGNTIATRLEILHDSRHGTYGVSALVLLLLVRVGALAGLVAISPFAAACVWIGAGVLARSGAMWLTLALAPARHEGSASTVGRVAPLPFWGGMAISLALAFIFAAPFAGLLGLIVAVAVLALICLGWARLCAHLIGGQTGDLIGALQALLEIGALSVFVTAAGLI
jgi:adenosylcobinamide-GDP ribazoletransferase